VVVGSRRELVGKTEKMGCWVRIMEVENGGEGKEGEWDARTMDIQRGKKKIRGET